MNSEENKSSEKTDEPKIPTSLDFDLVLTRIPVNLKDKEGVVHAYYLEELNGEDRDIHLDDLGDRMKYDGPAGKARMKTMKAMQSNLVGQCLYKVSGDGKDDELVPSEVVQKWPARIVQRLYDVANDISALTEKAEKAAKKG